MPTSNKPPASSQQTPSQKDLSEPKTESIPGFDQLMEESVSGEEVKAMVATEIGKALTDCQKPAKPAVENNTPYMKAAEAYEQRLSVCEKCDKYIGLAKICGVCKCFMPFKVRLKKAQCPEGKW